MSGNLSWQKFYPVEGGSAVAELLVGCRVWADLALENIRLDQRAGDRLTEARGVFRLHGSLDSLDLDAALKNIEEARNWLLENERGRDPEYFAGPSL